MLLDSFVKILVPQGILARSAGVSPVPADETPAFQQVGRLRYVDPA